MARAASHEANEPNIEDYNYINKTRSREILREAISNIMDGDVSKKKIIALSSWQGLDIQQVFDPIGFKRKNITVVERESAVIELMKKNHLFDGVNIIHSDLKDFNTDEKFDVIYLDFKCQPTDEIIDIIRRFTVFNTKVDTCIYINLLAKREKKYVTKKYQYIEDATMNEVMRFRKSLKDADDEEEKRLREFVHVLCLAMGNEDPKFMNELMEDDYRRNYLLKYMKQSAQYHSDPMIKEMIDEMERFEEKRITRKKAKSVITFDHIVKEVEERTNNHILRAAFIRNLVWDSINLVVDRFHLHSKEVPMERFMDVYSRARPHLNWDETDLDNKTITHDMVTNFIRLISNSLFVNAHFQFIYYGRERSPFISSIFHVINAMKWLKALKFISVDADEDSSKSAMIQSMLMGLSVIHHACRRNINMKSLIGKLRNAIKKQLKNDSFAEAVQPSEMWLKTRSKELEVDAISNMIRLYKALRKYRILEIQDNVIEINTYGHAYDRINVAGFHYDAERLKDNVDIPTVISAFYILVELLHGQVHAKMQAFFSHPDLIVVDDAKSEDSEDVYLKTHSDHDGMMQLDNGHEEDHYSNDPLYVRRKPSTDGLSEKEINERKALIKHYAERYYSSLKSGQITVRINRDEDIYPPASDYEVRGEKVAKTRKDNDERRRIDEIEIIPISMSREDVIEIEETFMEGARKEIIVTKVERDPNVIRRAYEVHGKKCQACGYTPQNKFSNVSDNDTVGLHVHHNKLLSTAGEIEINPTRDTNVLCAVCHAYIHYNSDEILMTLDELREYVKENSRD